MATYPNQRYRLTLTTLSPLHIGTGRTLLRDYDYVTHRGNTWIINEQALAELAFERGELDEMVKGRPAAELLKPSDYQNDSTLFRYILAGEPRSQARGSVIQTQMKNVFDQPYIAGSSLKGALRTGLMVSLFDKCIKQPWRASDLGRKPKDAAQSYENKTFVAPYEKGRGQDPNYDLMRAVRVSDSDADIQQRLSLLNVSVVKWRGEVGAPIELEAIPKGVSFVSELSLDGYLLGNARTAQGIDWGELLTKRLSMLPKVMNAWVAERLENEIQRPREGLWRSQFAELKHLLYGIGEDEFLFQLGWGGGWDSKTIGVKLRQDPHEFASMVNQFRLLRKGTFKEGERFPRSRRVQVGLNDDKPRAELGWLRVKMEQLT